MTGLGFSSALLDTLHARAGDFDREVVEGVVRLSTLFTTGRASLDEDYLANRALRRAYLLYFFPVNYAKVETLLREMPPLPSRSLRVLDLGSGPAVASLAVLHGLSEPEKSGAQRGVYIVAADRSGAGLREAEALWSMAALAPKTSEEWAFRPIMLDLERPGARAPWKQEPFDLIILSNSLNELFRSSRDPIARRAKFLEQVLDALTPDGTLMIIEPALRETARALHATRDLLIKHGAATVYSPCLHERPCPALNRVEDWCHEERPWSPPAVVEAIDREVGFIKDALKFSYLLLRKDGLTIVDRDISVHRVVSERLVMKGEQRFWLCNETGRQLVGRLEKARSEANVAFDEWHRGAIVRLDQIERRRTVGRILDTAKAELIRPIRA